jgi:hypothetical protein
MAAMTAIVPGTARTARTALESRAGTTPAVWATIGTAATAVWAATAAAIASTTLRALETGAGIAADAGGITREVFARSSGAADTGGASLTGKQDDILLDGAGFRANSSCVRFDRFWFGVFVFDVSGVFVYDVPGIT